MALWYYSEVGPITSLDPHLLSLIWTKILYWTRSCFRLQVHCHWHYQDFRLFSFFLTTYSSSLFSIYFNDRINLHKKYSQPAFRKGHPSISADNFNRNCKPITRNTAKSGTSCKTDLEKHWLLSSTRFQFCTGLSFFTQKVEVLALEKEKAMPVANRS